MATLIIDAIRAADDEEVGVVLTDVNMPGVGAGID